MLYLALLPKYEIKEIHGNLQKMLDTLSTTIFFFLPPTLENLKDMVKYEDNLQNKT